MAYSIERFSQLVGRLYEAPLDHGALPAALRELAGLAGVEKATVVNSFPTGARAISAAAGVESKGRSTPIMPIFTGSIFCPEIGAAPIAFTRTNANSYWPDFTESEFFNDWARPNENHQIVFVSMPLAGGVQSSLILIASAQDRGFGSAGQITLLQLLAPHFQRMMTTAARLTDLERERDQYLSALGGSPYGLVVLDRRARVRHATGPAVEIMRADDGLRLTARGIRAANPVADRRLGALIAVLWPVTKAGDRARSVRSAFRAHPLRIPSWSRPFRLRAHPIGEATAGTAEAPMKARSWSSLPISRTLPGHRRNW